MQEGGSKRLFFEKRNKKLLVTVGFGTANASARRVAKVFCFFFQKRSACFPTIT
jgi:hypothetical protein